jgi:hypothetical protein
MLGTKHFKRRHIKWSDDWYMPEPNSGCHIWLGSITRTGYGARGITVCERWRYQQDNGDGRPAVDKLTHGGDDPLLEALKEGKR